jgi:hypothetical protein
MVAGLKGFVKRNSRTDMTNFPQGAVIKPLPKSVGARMVQPSSRIQPANACLVAGRIDLKSFLQRHCQWFFTQHMLAVFRCRDRPRRVHRWRQRNVNSVNIVAANQFVVPGDRVLDAVLIGVPTRPLLIAAGDAVTPTPSVDCKSATKRRVMRPVPMIPNRIVLFVTGRSYQSISAWRTLQNRSCSGAVTVALFVRVTR